MIKLFECEKQVNDLGGNCLSKKYVFFLRWEVILIVVIIFALCYYL